MNLSDIRFVILALHLMRDPQRRTALLPLSMGSSMPPTSYRATSCNGDGTGSGLVGTETKRGASLVFLASCRFRRDVSI